MLLCERVTFQPRCFLCLLRRSRPPAGLHWVADREKTVVLKWPVGIWTWGRRHWGQTDNSVFPRTTAIWVSRLADCLLSAVRKTEQVTGFTVDLSKHKDRRTLISRSVWPSKNHLSIGTFLFVFSFMLFHFMDGQRVTVVLLGKTRLKRCGNFCICWPDLLHLCVNWLVWSHVAVQRWSWMRFKTFKMRALVPSKGPNNDWEEFHLVKSHFVLHVYLAPYSGIKSKSKIMFGYFQGIYIGFKFLPCFVWVKTFGVPTL